MKFISKPRVITAQQFILGQSLPEGVKFHESCANPDSFGGQPQEQLPAGAQNPMACPLDGHYYVRRSENENVIVKPGDWIVSPDRVPPSFETIYFDVIKPEVMAEQFQEVVGDSGAADNLTPAAQHLRTVLLELKETLQAAADHAVCVSNRDEEMKWAGYAANLHALLSIPYSDFIPKERCPNCGWDGESVEWSGAGGNVGTDGQVPIDSQFAEKLNPPDIRTLDGALRFIDYHKPSESQAVAHRHINVCFQHLLRAVWEQVPEGAGRTVFVRSLNRARHDANSAISNLGA